MHNSYPIRCAAALLALLCALPAASSCGSADNGTTVETAPNVDTAATEAVETEELTGRAAVRDNLPDTLDLGGKEIRILTRTDDRDTKIEFIAESETGDVVEGEKNKLAKYRDTLAGILSALESLK